MTILQWIIIGWCTGTCIATVLMVLDSEDSKMYKKLVSDHEHMFAPKFITLLFYISVFVHSLLWWWTTIPILLFEWIRIQLMFAVVNRILKVVGTGQPHKVARLRRLLKIVSYKDGPKEEKKDTTAL